MVYIESAKEFLELIYKHEEVILCAEGVEKNITLEFLKYTNFLNRICCLTTERVDPYQNTLQNFDHALPIVPFEYLSHFHESGLMVVAVPPQSHRTFEQKLSSLGFQKVIFLNQTTVEQMTAYVNQALKSGEALTRTITDMKNKLDKMEYLIAEQNELCAVNTKAFAEYRNCFRGKKVVLFATGPTSKFYTPIPEAIHIGVNFAWRREDIPLNFLFTQDMAINKPGQVQVEEGFDRVLERIFIGKFSDGIGYKNLEFSESFSLIRSNISRFFSISHNINQPMYQDICYHSLMDFCTIAHPALHFALFTYPKEIYLVGCDTSRTGHFYNPDKQIQNDMSIKDIKIGYARAKMFAKQYYPDTEIISINPVGLKGLFKDIYTDEYKESLSKGGE